MSINQDLLKTAIGIWLYLLMYTQGIYLKTENRDHKKV